jgi:hypothetical protein
MQPIQNKNVYNLYSHSTAGPRLAESSAVLLEKQLYPQINKKSPELKDPYRAHYIRLLVSALIQINTVRILQSCFIKINVNIIITYRPGSSKWTLYSSRFPTKKVYAFFLSFVCATRPLAVTILSQ